MRIFLPVLALLTACDFSFIDGDTNTTHLGAVRDASDLETMELDIDGVDVVIGAHDKEEVLVLLHVKGEDVEPADVLDLELSREGDGGFLRAVATEELKRASLEVLLPRSVRVFGELGEGDVAIGGVEGFDLFVADGDLVARNVPGPSSLVLDQGDVAMDSIGSLEIEVFDGDLVLNDIEGDAFVRNAQGDIVISRVAGSLDLEDASGDLVVNRVEADATIVDGGGDIVVNGVGGRLRLTDGDGDIVLTNVPDHEIVEDSSGDVVIANR